MRTVDVQDQVLGSDRGLTLRYLLVAGGAVVAGLGLQYWRWAATPRGLAWSVLAVDLVWLVAALAVGLAAVPGYLDDGLLAGWAVGTAPFVARTLGPAVVPARGFAEPLVWRIVVAILLGVVAGTLGYGLGAGGRRIRDRVVAADRSGRT